MTAPHVRRSPVALARRGLALLPPVLRRRVARAVVLSAVLAVFEAAAFASLFLLIQLIARGGEAPPAVASLLGATGDREAQAARLGGLTLLLLLARSAGTLFLLRVQANIQATTDAALAGRLYSAFMATPYSTLVQRNSAETMVNIAYRVPDVAANSVGAVIALAADVAVLIGVVGTLLVVAPLLAVGVVGYFVVVSVGLLRVLTPSIRESAFAESAQAVAAQQSLQEGIGGVKAIKANELIEFFSDRFFERRETLRRVRQRRIFLGRLPSFYLETSLFLGLALLAVVVFRFGREDVITTFGVLVAASLRTLPSVNRIVGVITGIRSSEAALTAVEAELRDMAPAEVAPPSRVAEPLVLQRLLELRDVSFSYEGSTEPALRDLSLQIKAGEAVGLVGGSGAGKTTLVDVVLGLLVPSSGRLLVDGVDVVGEQIGAWRRTIGYVPQDVYLLDGTLWDNVVFGRPDATQADVQEAIALAQLHDLVAALPDGLGSRVGERGGRLSGGQRQRIGVARALLGRPSLLILDEATSALDNRTEAAVTAAIAGLRGRTTTIVIAHRLSTVKSCDRIVLLESGACVGQGSFEELRRHNANFAALVRLGQLDDAPDPDHTPRGAPSSSSE